VFTKAISRMIPYMLMNLRPYRILSLRERRSTKMHSRQSLESSLSECYVIYMGVMFYNIRAGRQ